MGRAKKQRHGPPYTMEDGKPATGLTYAKSAGADPGKTRQAHNSWKRHMESVNIWGRKREAGRRVR